MAQSLSERAREFAARGLLVRAADGGGLEDDSAFWLDELQESFDELLHPRDRRGRWMEKLDALAADIHRGQVDGQGVDYMEHIRAVTSAVSDEAKPVALFHDSLEDHPDSEPRVASVLLPHELEAVKLLSHPPDSDESYADYVERLANTPGEVGDLAREVKTADLRHNLGRLTPELERLRDRYEKALARLGASSLQEAFDPAQPRWPRGSGRRAGQFRPKLGAQVEATAKALERDMQRIRAELERMRADGWMGRTQPERLRRLGAMINDVAERYSTVQAYRDRRWALESQWDDANQANYRIQSKLDKYLIRGGQTLSDERAAERDALLKEWDAVWERQKDLTAEIARLANDEYRARQDAVLGVLSKIRPMGGKIATGDTTFHVDTGAALPKAQTEHARAVREVSRMLPAAWIKDMNDAGVVHWDLWKETRGQHYDLPHAVRERVFRRADYESEEQYNAAVQKFMDENGVDPRDVHESTTSRRVWVPAGVDSKIKVAAGRARVYLHELLHRVQTTQGAYDPERILPRREANSSLRHRAEWEFLVARTGAAERGEVVARAQKLANLVPGAAYEPWEVAIPDDFMVAYMGKVYDGSYANRYNEVLPMAVEYLFYGGTYRTDFRRSDAQMADWITGLLAAT